MKFSFEVVQTQDVEGYLRVPPAPMLFFRRAMTHFQLVQYRSEIMGRREEGRSSFQIQSLLDFPLGSCLHLQRCSTLTA